MRTFLEKILTVFIYNGLLNDMLYRPDQPYLTSIFPILQTISTMEMKILREMAVYSFV